MRLARLPAVRAERTACGLLVLAMLWPAASRSEFVTGFEISESEKRDLIAFLGSLTDGRLLEDPKLSDPWTAR